MTNCKSSMRERRRMLLSKTSSATFCRFDSKDRSILISECWSSHEFHCKSVTSGSFDLRDLFVIIC